MASIVEIKNVTSGQAEKKMWTAPTLQVISINEAMGARTGPHCDRFGSLSIGTGCPD
jgi:hypothetical protein